MKLEKYCFMNSYLKKGKYIDCVSLFALQQALLLTG
jgi:hypothetical protein